MHPEHAEGFTIMPVEVFVVHLMRPAYRTNIRIVGAGEPFQSLVDDHVVNDEICEAIGHHPKSHCLEPIDFFNGAVEQYQEAGYGEDDEEGIVLFEGAVLFLVMVFMEIPEKSMHYKFVCQPGDEFHYQEGCHD